MLKLQIGDSIVQHLVRSSIDFKDEYENNQIQDNITNCN